jgi:hypothetical protein
MSSRLACGLAPWHHRIAVPRVEALLPWGFDDVNGGANEAQVQRVHQSPS